MTSFDHALPPVDSELVRDAIKDPYNFEFISLESGAKEKQLEKALLQDVESFLMEMGRGFALVLHMRRGVARPVARDGLR